MIARTYMRELAVRAVAGIVLFIHGSAEFAAEPGEAETPALKVGIPLEDKSPGSPSPGAAPPMSEGSTAGQERDDNTLRMKFIWCPPGTFLMGTPASDSLRKSIITQGEATLTKGFWLGKFEVTQSEWTAIAGTAPWHEQREVRDGASFPATYLNWNEAIDFCDKFTKRVLATGRLPPGWTYSLPTEAQWEYACRASTTTRFWFGDDDSPLSAHEWWGGFAGGNARHERYAHKVGQKAANPWGLHDMHGNVSEWCRDSFRYNMPGNTHPIGGVDPRFIENHYGLRVFRGGSWRDDAPRCRAGKSHGAGKVRYRMSTVGLRVCLRPLWPDEEAGHTAAFTGKKKPKTDYALLKTGGLENRERISLRGEPVTAADLADLKSLGTLQVLDLCLTQVSDDDVARVDWANCRSLKEIDLSHTRITAAGLAQLREVGGLERLTLFNTETTDAGLVNLMRFANLRSLGLGDTQISDAGLEHVLGLTRLEHLDISGTGVTDAGVARLRSLSALRFLCVERTRVTNSAIKELQDALPDLMISH